MSKLYFTRSGADRIMQKKQDLLIKLKTTQGKKAEAADVGGNQWHDNFSFEQLMRDEDMLNLQIKEVNEIISRMVIVDQASTDISKLRIGHIAVLETEGDIKSYLIGGFEDSEEDTDPPVISYLAPLIRQFIGKAVGHVSSVQIEGRLKKVTLKDIILPKKRKEE